VEEIAGTCGWSGMDDVVKASSSGDGRFSQQNRILSPVGSVLVWAGKMATKRVTGTCMVGWMKPLRSWEVRIESSSWGGAFGRGNRIPA
jgi:hypothetical protein